MYIEHLAIWVEDLEKMRDFYVKYFGFRAGELYYNSRNSFYSYFLDFPGAKSRLELMQMPGIPAQKQDSNTFRGLAHYAIRVKDKDQVHNITEKLRQEGYRVQSEARLTGDHYYESAIEDPEGNYVEITAGYQKDAHAG